MTMDLEEKKEGLIVILSMQKDEKNIVLLLLLHSFLIGLSFTFLISSANSLFLSVYSVTALPYVYTAAALVLPIIAIAYNKLQRSIRITRLFLYMVLFLFSLICLGHSLISYYHAPWSYFVLMIVLEVTLVYFELEFWGLVGTLFDIRQSKRLLALVGSGQDLAMVIGGFCVALIVTTIGTRNLLFLVETFILLTCLVVFVILKIYGSRFAGPKDDKEEEKEESKKDFKGRYLLLIFAITVLSSFSFYIVDYIFYEKVTIHYPNEEELAGFIGMFFAVAGVINFIFSSLFSGWFLNRFGLLVGLLVLPVFVMIGGSSILVTGMIAGSSLFLILIAIMTKLFYISAETSIDKPSFKLLYQVFSARKKASVSAKVEGLIDPIAGGAAGLVLIVLTSMLGVGAAGLSLVLVGIALLWIVLVVSLKKEYTNYLTRSLAKKRLGSDLEIDSRSLNIVEKGLQSKYPAEVLYALGLLEELDKELFYKAIQRLLIGFSTKSVEIQSFVLQKIEENLLDFKKEIKALLSQESDTENKTRLIRTYALIAKEEAYELLSECLDAPEIRVQQSAIIGLMKADEPRAREMAEKKFNTLAVSRDVQERIIACEIIAELKLPLFDEPLIGLLEDHDMRVRKSAILASSGLKNPKLLSCIIKNLGNIRLVQSCSQVLLAGEDEAFEVLKHEFEKEDVSDELRIRIIKIYAKMKHKNVTRILIDNLESKNENIYDEIVYALYSSDALLEKETKLLILNKIRSEIRNSVYLMQSMADLKELPLMSEALEYQLLKNKNRLFCLLSLLYDKESIGNAKRNFEQSDPKKAAYAFELLDNIISQEIKTDVFILLEEASMSKKLEKFHAKFPQKPMKVSQRLLDMSEHDLFLSNWVRASLLYTMGKRKEMIFSSYICGALKASDPLIRECAVWAIREVNKDAV